MLVNDDSKYERGLIRVLLEYGLKPWNEEITVADYLIKEIEENELDKMMQEELLTSIYLIYKKMYHEDEHPVTKHFLYHPDEKISALVVKAMGIPLEISPNWDTHYDGKILKPEDMYKEEVSSTLHYLKLKKLKQLILENQQLLETATKADDQLLYMQTHQHLKAIEKAITKNLGMVIVKL